MSSGFDHDPHSERGHPCPRNRFGITDYQQLQPIETVFTLKRARELETLGVTGSFDSAHLRAIHKHLFQDVFPWAGDFRVATSPRATPCSARPSTSPRRSPTPSPSSKPNPS